MIQGQSVSLPWFRSAMTREVRVSVLDVLGTTQLTALGDTCSLLHGLCVSRRVNLPRSPSDTEGAAVLNLNDKGAHQWLESGPSGLHPALAKSLSQGRVGRPGLDPTLPGPSLPLGGGAGGLSFPGAPPRVQPPGGRGRDENETLRLEDSPSFRSCPLTPASKMPISIQKS